MSTEDKSFWEYFVELSEKVKLWDSLSEEHNRYVRPPKGVSVTRWAEGVFRGKYGDYRSGKRFKKINE